MITLVGSVVGEVSALPSGSGSTLTDTGLGYDMAIGGLGFKLKISDENKYERATAQFKKDQFDNSTEYGDQSLLGYWTRGQFSFHRGAGVTYYDTADGETVLNRYRSGVGVKPFTPGSVSLCPAWNNTTSSGPFTGPITWGGSGNGFLAFRDGTTLKYATALYGATTSYVPTAGTVTQATTGPLCAYVATTSNKIERVGIAAGAPASGAIYTHSTGFNGLFHAKDRLWAVDQNQVWYQLSPNPAAPPVAIVAGDKVFAAGDGWDSRWCLTDTPGPVLMGNGGRIYAVKVDSSTGVVPSMSGPVQVAELPTGEFIRDLAYHLGFLALVTNLGVRVGVVSEAGQVTFGPLLVEWTEPGLEVGATTIARRGSSVFVAGNVSVYEVNLAQQIGDGLEFGWTQLPPPYTDFTALDRAYGVFTWAGGTLVAWAGKTSGSPAASLKHEDVILATEGTLYTGFHRFGTLEPKKFHTVKVRCSGTGGTVAVYKVLSDGSEVSLITIDLATSTGEDQITLGMDTPTELVGLKFVLARYPGDSTVGPTLLGYQLRALPAPKRQRLIRFPLMLMDVERRGVTRASGYEGSAWARLEALEDMEQSGGVFQFQDFRTGESGTCYIESVEHAGSTPPGKDNNGFGGVVLLTIRKL